MDPWSMIGNGISQGFGAGMQNPESQLFQLMQRRRMGGANPAAVNTVQQQMMQPADMGNGMPIPQGNPMMPQMQGGPQGMPPQMGQGMGMPFGNNPYQRFRFY